MVLYVTVYSMTKWFDDLFICEVDKVDVIFCRHSNTVKCIKYK